MALLKLGHLVTKRALSNCLFHEFLGSASASSNIFNDAFRVSAFISQCSLYFFPHDPHEFDTIPDLFSEGNSICA
jgi:hypothetical protein